MPFKQLLITFICLLFLSSVHAQELAMTGEFYAESVSAKSGEVWLGLYRVGDEYELRSTTLTVNERRSERMRTDFKEVLTDQPTEPLFLVRGLEELQPGKVETMVPDEKSIYPGQRERFWSDRGDYYTLVAVGEAFERRPFEVGIRTYKLMLWQTMRGWTSRRSQTLIESAASESFPRVIWAGDLDGDGEIDLFIDTAPHYQIIERELFLSSVAKDEEIVGKAATWRTSTD